MPCGSEPYELGA